MGAFVSFHVQETVSLPHFGVVVGTRGHLIRLAVSNEEESGSTSHAAVALYSRRSGLAFRSIQSVASRGSGLAGTSVLARESRRSGQSSLALGTGGAREARLA